MKRLTFKAAALISVCLLTSFKNVQAYDLWQAYLDARDSDPIYLSALAEQGIADAQRKQARAAILPAIGLTASARRTRETFLTAPNRSLTTHPITAQVVLSQPLIDISSLTAFKQVGINSDSSVLRIQQAHQELIVRVVQAYFTALLGQGNASIAEAQRSTAAKQVAIAQKSFEVGNSTIIDKNEAEAAYYNARATEITTVSERDNAVSALEDLVGHKIDEPLSPLIEPLTLKMPVPETQESWVNRARTDNYAIRIAKLSDGIAQLEINRRGQQYLPKIDLVASQQWKHTNLNHVANVHSRTSSVGLELSMPLFDGGLISAQVDEARALQKQSMQAVRNTDNTVSQATRVAYSQAVSGLSSIEALESARRASTASVKANEVGYKLGMRINIDVLNAQNTDAQTKYNLAQAQYNTIIGNVNLKAAIAQLGLDDIRYINALLGKPQVGGKQIGYTLKTTDRTQDPISVLDDSSQHTPSPSSTSAVFQSKSESSTTELNKITELNKVTDSRVDHLKLDDSQK